MSHIDKYLEEIDKLKKQRDALLAACKTWKKFITKLPDDFELQIFLYHLFNEAKELTEQAIAEAETK